MAGKGKENNDDSEHANSDFAGGSVTAHFSVLDFAAVSFNNELAARYAGFVGCI